MDLLDEFLTLAFAAAVGVTFLGGILRGFAGFGTGLLLVPMLAIIYTPVEAVAILLLLASAGGFQLLPGAWRHADWRTVLPITVAVVVATPLGAWALIVGDPQLVKRGIGAVIVFSALLMLSGWTYRGPRGAGVSALFGLVGGMMTGFGGIGGPVTYLYLISQPGPAQVLRSNVVVTSVTTLSFAVLSILVGGALHLETALRAAVLFAPYVLGQAVGARLFRRTPDAAFRRVVLIVLMVIGLSLVIA
jgi:uncharacterized membrane protein YfcA